jgi:hypothetical protein
MEVILTILAVAWSSRIEVDGAGLKELFVRDLFEGAFQVFYRFLTISKSRDGGTQEVSFRS